MNHKRRILLLLLAAVAIAGGAAAQPTGELLYAVETRAVRLQSPFPPRQVKAEDKGKLADAAQSVKDAQAVKAAHNGGTKGTAAALPQLKGIIQGDGVAVAVLEADSKSGVYRSGDVVGGYVVGSISGSEVLLTNQGGTCRLRIGQ